MLVAQKRFARIPQISPFQASLSICCSLAVSQLCTLTCQSPRAPGSGRPGRRASAGCLCGTSRHRTTLVSPGGAQFGQFHGPTAMVGLACRSGERSRRLCAPSLALSSSCRGCGPSGRPVRAPALARRIGGLHRVRAFDGLLARSTHTLRGLWSSGEGGGESSCSGELRLLSALLAAPPPGLPLGLPRTSGVWVPPGPDPIGETSRASGE